MADTLTIVSGGADDITMHDPAVSAVQQTFSRSGSIVPTVIVKKMGMNSIPGLDAPYVTGGRGGFWELHNGSPTQANLHAESMVRLLRKQSRRVVNFEGMGGIPNDSSDGTAETNRNIWD